MDHNATTESEAKLARYRFLRNQGALKNISDPSQITNEQLIEKVQEVCIITLAMAKSQILMLLSLFTHIHLFTFSYSTEMTLSRMDVYSLANAHAL